MTHLRAQPEEEPEDLLPQPAQVGEVLPASPPHVYDGERCIHCGRNLYDVMLYGPEACIEYAGRKRSWTFEAGRNDAEDHARQEELRHDFGDTFGLFDVGVI